MQHPMPNDSAGVRDTADARLSPTATISGDCLSDSRFSGALASVLAAHAHGRKCELRQGGRMKCQGSITHTALRGHPILCNILSPSLPTL